jgi:Predicted membrane protein (DUF2142)
VAKAVPNWVTILPGTIEIGMGMAEDGNDGPGGDGSAVRRWRGHLALVLVFFVPAALWAMSGPLYSVPDEPDQAVRAVSIWFGQLSGSRIDGEPAVVRNVDVPAAWATRTIPAVCYAFRPDLTPDHCDDYLLEGGTQHVQVRTYDGGFPPAYFTLVGWGGRIWGRPFGVYVMRLASAALSALLLAWSVRTLQRVMPLTLALVGVLAAATPMTYFLAGSINPNGFEVAAAIALWCHVIALVRWPECRPGLPPPRVLVGGAVVAATALALTRLLSPVFVGLIVGLGLLGGSVPAWRALARDRACRRALVAITALSLVALGLVVRSGSLIGLGGSPIPPDANPWWIVARSSVDYLKQMVGRFGWLDTPLPKVLIIAWWSVVGALVAVGAVVGPARRLLGVVATSAITVAMPIVIQAPRAAQYGLTWQGRHGLPIAVGVPLLAVLVISRGAVGVAGDGGRIPKVRRWLTIGATAVLVAVNVGSLWVNLHRYTLGLHNPAWNLAEGTWQPRLGAWSWVALAALWATAVLAFVTMRSRRDTAV